MSLASFIPLTLQVNPPGPKRENGWAMVTQQIVTTDRLGPDLRAAVARLLPKAHDRETWPQLPLSLNSTAWTRHTPVLPRALVSCSVNWV